MLWLKRASHIYWNWVSINIMHYGEPKSDLLIICHLYLWKFRLRAPELVNHILQLERVGSPHPQFTAKKCTIANWLPHTTQILVLTHLLIQNKKKEQLLEIYFFASICFQFNPQVAEIINWYNVIRCEIDYNLMKPEKWQECKWNSRLYGIIIVIF